MAVDVGLVAIVVGALAIGGVALWVGSLRVGLAGAATGVVYMGLTTEAELAMQVAWVLIVGLAIVFGFRLVEGVTG